MISECYIDYAWSSNDHHSANTSDKYLNGVLFIETEAQPNSETYIYFNIDTSASMDDICHDGFTKLHYLKTTLKSILKYLVNHNINAKVCFASFNDDVTYLTDGFESCDSSTLDSLIARIFKLKTVGCTNLESTFVETKRIISTYKDPQGAMLAPAPVQIVHILLTDGEVTKGDNKKESLSEKLSVPNVMNYFVGFGTTHDSYLLSELSKMVDMGEYKCIDKYNSCSAVYAEIIHHVTHPFIQHLCIEDSSTKDPIEIYDWKTNTWVSTLLVPFIPSEAKRIFHVRTLNTHGATFTSCKLSYTGNLASNGEEVIERDGQNVIYAETIPFLIDQETGHVVENDLSEYVFRLKALQLMWRITELQKNDSHLRRNIQIQNGYNQFVPIDDVDDDESQSCDALGDTLGPNLCLRVPVNLHVSTENERNDEVKDIKKSIKQLVGEMNIYLTNLYLETPTDKQKINMIKLLKSDLKVSWNGISSVNGYMYSSSRQHSQATQSAFTIDDDETTIVESPYMTQTLHSTITEITTSK